ncbi:beta-xylosidase [Streptomyces sp. NRRL S-87]|uniref:beta-xylosidase n=1 Tax=Streptomyces sp. NRRL S-87 TaxID=1463920 RepID=UPI000689A716|nr:beta-xylosidase [Streptomyces sp. NRRL S-87]
MTARARQAAAARTRGAAGGRTRRAAAHPRRPAAALAALGALALAAAAPAGAANPVEPGGARTGPVEFPTHCVPPQEAGLPPADGTTTALITVDNPRPRVGDTVTVTYRVTATTAVNPLDTELPADTLTPAGKVVLGGAQPGGITVTGPRKNDPVDARAGFAAFAMTGTFTVTRPGEITLAPGDYTLHTSHLMELDTPCTVDRAHPAPVSGRLTAAEAPGVNARAIALATPAGRPGAKVHVVGAGFTPGAAVSVAGRAGTAETADRATATADERGVLQAELAVTDPATTGVVAYEGAGWTEEAGAGPAAYTVTDAAPLPPGSQKVGVTVEPGGLTMTQAGEEIALSPVPYGQGGTARGRIRPVTVKDARGGPAGWTLTGRLTDFTGPAGGRIDGAGLRWTPSCTTKDGSPSTCVPGTPGPVGADGATLAGTPDAALVGGEFTVGADVDLTVPPYTAPGAYAALLTLTLS